MNFYRDLKVCVVRKSGPSYYAEEHIQFGILAASCLDWRPRDLFSTRVFFKFFFSPQGFYCVMHPALFILFLVFPRGVYHGRLRFVYLGFPTMFILNLSSFISNHLDCLSGVFFVFILWNVVYFGPMSGLWLPNI